jgi:hypothetical protein
MTMVINLPSGDLFVAVRTQYQRKSKKQKTERVVEIIEEAEPVEEQGDLKTPEVPDVADESPLPHKHVTSTPEPLEPLKPAKPTYTIHSDFTVESCYDNCTKFHRWIEGNCCQFTSYKFRPTKKDFCLSQGGLRILNTPNAGTFCHLAIE